MVEQHGKTLVPQIRFAGFTDPWEQRKLGELTESYSGGTPAAGESEFYGGSIPFIRSAEIASKSTELFLTGKGYESSSARMVKPGDVLYALYGATSGEVAVSKQKGAINQAILAILPHDDCDARYLAAWLRRRKDYIVTTFLQGGQGNLSGVIVKNLEVAIPSLPEQQRIGSCLSLLDSLITLHQRKYDKLCVLKKSMLDKMFPKGGSLYPEIRFAGFADPWEQRKVGDFLSESRVKGNTGLNSRKLTVKLWGKGVIEKNDFGGSEHTQYFIRHKGQFIYSKLDFLNSAFGVIPEKLDGYESTADLPAFDLVEMNPHFMFFTAVQEGFYLKHGSAADGSRKAKRIHVNTFLEMPIMVPTVAEQDFIVEYLQSLDCLITLHQRKLELLRNIKKSMLDKMFV